MSFILDALKKSENERQRGLGPSFSDVKSAARGRRIPVLWLAIGLLLAVNVVALGVLLVRRGEPAQGIANASGTAIAAPPIQAPPAVEPAASQAAIASPLPAAAAPSASVVDEPGVEAAAPEPLLDRPQLANFATDRGLPTINDVISQGRARLPDLHLDMHVFVQAPAQRFVTINSRKFREGMQIEEGLRVERITPDGVVLNQQGLRFLLPRQ